MFHRGRECAGKVDQGRGRSCFRASHPGRSPVRPIGSLPPERAEVADRNPRADHPSRRVSALDPFPEAGTAPLQRVGPLHHKPDRKRQYSRMSRECCAQQAYSQASSLSGRFQKREDQRANNVAATPDPALHRAPVRFALVPVVRCPRKMPTGLRVARRIGRTLGIKGRLPAVSRILQSPWAGSQFTLDESVAAEVQTGNPRGNHEKTRNKVKQHSYL